MSSYETGVGRARTYNGFHSRDAHVEDRRSKWLEWKALSREARRKQHLAYRTERLDNIGPFRGVTTDGALVPQLFSIMGTGLSTRPIMDAASEYLSSLDAEQRNEATLPLDAPDWRLWLNGMDLRLRHGVLLEDLADEQRQAALRLMQSSLSSHGFARVQNIMRLNRVLGEITGDAMILNEWRYYLTVFGTPDLDEPWGWQLDGHHLNVNCLILGGQIVLTPCFMGAEPRISDRGPFPTARAFDEEQRAGLELLSSLSATQLDKAILFSSMLSVDLPESRRHPTEGRMRAGAFSDNVVMPYEGIRADQLSPGQRELLMRLIGTYVCILPDGHDDVRRREIEAHLDETHFAWIGGTHDDGPFFYKVQSPVLLVEFDHHKGVFLDNSEPEGFHAHSVVRTPNGNDYGRDLLRQHYERHPH
jgi:hypothetical protein